MIGRRSRRGSTGPARSDDAMSARRRRGRRAARGRHAAPRRNRLARVGPRMLVPLLLAVVTVGVLVLGAFPTRTLLDQRASATAAEAELERLEAANAEARAEVEALRTDAVIEQIARKEYGLARPGEELYHVLPAAQDPVRVPEAWPFNGLGTTLEP